MGRLGEAGAEAFEAGQCSLASARFQLRPAQQEGGGPNGNSRSAAIRAATRAAAGPLSSPRSTTRRRLCQESSMFPSGRATTRKVPMGASAGRRAISALASSSAENAGVPSISARTLAFGSVAKAAPAASRSDQASEPTNRRSP